MAELIKNEKQKMKTALKIKKSLEKEMENHNLRSSSPESEDIDFKKVIHPLGYYIHDKERMIEEIFSIIRGEKLRKMLPPLLKNYSLEELKADCLVHLLGMSKKRVVAILEGRELNSSSDSESENSSTSSESGESLQLSKLESKSNIDEDDLLDISVSKKEVDSLVNDKSKVLVQNSKKSRIRLKKKIKTEKEAPDCAILISDDDSDEVNSKTAKKIKKTNHEHASSKLLKRGGVKPKGKKRKKSKELSVSNVRASSGKSDAEERKLVHNGETSSIDPNEKGKTLLEILELEMRARAIRALLKNTSDVDDLDPISASNLKPVTKTGPKTDPRIATAIDEAIDQTLAEKVCAPATNEDGDDVEIIDEVDLCVTIDEDDENIEAVFQPNTSASEIDNNDAVPREASRKNDSERYEKQRQKENGVEKSSPAKKNDHLTRTSPHEEQNSKKSDTENGCTNVSDNASWPERWAENKNVKDVVRNSKICANIRKRMRFARMLKQKQSEENKQDRSDKIDLGSVEESSIAHYNLIKAYNSKNIDSAADMPKPANELSDSVENTGQNMDQKHDVDANVSIADYVPPPVENDPKTLIIDLSDEDLASISVSADNS